jgi:GR25 family glycosyltransferase involved in LPS biosynthesis
MKIPTFVINLPKDTDRRAFMEKQLTERGFDYEIIHAVLGVSEEAQCSYDEEFAQKENGRSLTNGEIGCSLSHRMIYEKIVREHIPFSLIFEDDAVLPDNFKNIIDKEVLRAKGLWDMLLFEYLPTGNIYLKAWIKASYERSKKNPLFLMYTLCKMPYILFVTFYEVVQRVYAKWYPGPRIFWRPLYHASAYLLTEEGAKKMLSLTYPIRFSADRLPNQARIRTGLRLRGYVPLMVRQNKSFESNII